MFYDWDWIGSIRIEQERRLKRWVNILQAKDASVAIVELGAGKSLATIRNTSENLARQLNGKFVRINPRDAEGPKGAISIALPALEALEGIERSLSK